MKNKKAKIVKGAIVPREFVFVAGCLGVKDKCRECGRKIVRRGTYFCHLCGDSLNRRSRYWSDASYRKREIARAARWRAKNRKQKR
jgi:hypothetical protein